MMYDRKKIEMLKQRYPKGTRICLDSMENDPQPIPPGTMGTVVAVDDGGDILMKWDNGRSLSIIPDIDSFHVVKQEEKQEAKHEKPDCPLIGADGNIYNLMGIASKTLKDNGMEDQASALFSRIRNLLPIHFLTADLKALKLLFPPDWLLRRKQV